MRKHLLVQTFLWTALLLGAAGCSDDSPPFAKNGRGQNISKTPNVPASRGRNDFNSDVLAEEKDTPAWVGSSNDEPFDIKQFLAMRALAEEVNAAPLYDLALAQICSAFGGERAAPLEERIRNLGDIDQLTSAALPEVEQVLAAAKPASEGVNAAQARPNCVFVTGLSADALFPHAQASRIFGKLSVFQLFAARTAGAFDSAEAAIRRCLRLSRDLRPRGHSVCQLVSIAMDGSLLLAIERFTLRDPSLTTEQCDRLLALLVEHERQGLDRYQEGLRMDYILARSSIHDLRTGRLTLDQIYDLVSGLDGDKRSSIGPIALNYEAEIAACNKLYAILFEAAASSIPGPVELAEFDHAIAQLKGDWEDFKSKVAAASRSERRKLRSQIPSMQFSLWTATPPALFEANRRSMAALACLEMLVSLRRYEVAHGRLPTTLSEAAGETILKPVPTDPYSGKPLRFALIAGKPTVYSVGKDFKDDGGLIDWNFGTQPGDFVFVLVPQDE